MMDRVELMKELESIKAMDGGTFDSRVAIAQAVHGDLQLQILLDIRIALTEITERLKIANNR